MGVHISYKDEDGAAASAKFLAESFRKAGIEVILSEKPKRTSSIIDIIVGFKPEEAFDTESCRPPRSWVINAER
jgi:hypothetical protein